MRHIPALILALFAVTGPAQAGLTVCNKSARDAKVALGRYNGHAWMSEGWWTIAPKACSVLIQTPLDARYYYLYATDKASGAWDGSTAFCVGTAAKFSVAGRSNCGQRGYDVRRFFQIDTNDNLNHTQTLQ